jgi:ribosomal protein RSM22 (predicted rRNA methylase)
LERHTIPKSQGRQEYYDARKVAWGDSFPHPPKNGPMLAPASLEKVVQKDKYGTGHSKVKSKKAERLFTYKEEQPGRRQRGVKGEKKVAGGETGRDGEVQDYELELGEDGQLKIVN